MPTNNISTEEQIREAISSSGYVCIDEIMKIALSSSEASYYRSKQPIGANADFITSPEISQMFGEMLGVWCVDMWHQLGKPDKVNLLELGPGSGALMRDLMRSIKSSDFYDAVHVQLLDINPILIKTKPGI